MNGILERAVAALEIFANAYAKKVDLEEQELNRYNHLPVEGATSLDPNPFYKGEVTVRPLVQTTSGAIIQPQAQVETPDVDTKPVVVPTESTVAKPKAKTAKPKAEKVEAPVRVAETTTEIVTTEVADIVDGEDMLVEIDADWRDETGEYNIPNRGTASDWVKPTAEDINSEAYRTMQNAVLAKSSSHRGQLVEFLAVVFTAKVAREVPKRFWPDVTNFANSLK